MCKPTTVYKAAQQIWTMYLELGPGKLADTCLNDYETAKRQFLEAASSELRPSFQASLGELTDLLHRCVHRSEGLCFVTGEAGLIPRKDQHERCEALLAQLAEWCEM